MQDMTDTNQIQEQANEEARRALDERMKKMEEYMGILRRELDNLVPPVKEFITKHPIGSISAILGVGVALGYLIGGSQNRSSRSRRRARRRHRERRDSDM